MANEIIEKVNRTIVKPEQRTITINDKARYIENVNTLNLSQSINLTTTINGHVITSNINPNNDFYNLFVLDYEDFAKGYFILKRNEALKYIDDDVAALHSLRDLESIQACKSYPCIFANKNKLGYQKPEVDQKLFFGYLASIEITDDGIKFTYSLLSSLMQTMMNNNLEMFKLKNTFAENELDKIHWSIKKLNLINVIHALGFNVASY